MKRFLLVIFLVLMAVPTLGFSSPGYISPDREVNLLPEYLPGVGEISSIDGNWIYIKENKGKDFSETYVIINKDTLIYSDKSLDQIKQSDLNVGDVITYYYNKHKPMIMIYPPQISADVIVLNESADRLIQSKIDKFDENLLSSDKRLRVNFDKSISLRSRDNKVINKENILNKDLLVFYSFTTKSLPPQTTPIKIINIEKEYPLVSEKILLNGRDFSLTNNLYVEENGEIMVPLREVVEKLGYSVKWNGKTFSIDVVREASYSNLSIGNKVYGKSKAIVKLDQEPVLKDAVTYVPLSFFDEVLELEYIVNKGTVNILPTTYHF